MTELSTVAVSQPRARGSVSLGVRSSSRGPELATLRQAGSLRALFLRGRKHNLTAVMVNTSGGVTGGDRFLVRASVGAGAGLTLTTQAAERAYRAQPLETGVIETRLKAEAGARVNWLPQETILFQECALRRQLTVDLDDGASALIVEPLVFGRLAMGEVLSAADFSDSIEIRRQGECVYLDRVRLAGDVAGLMARPAVGNAACAMATILFVHETAEAMLAPVRAVLPGTGGASQVGPGVLAIRLLESDSFRMRQCLIPLINLLHDDDLPRPWMI